MWTDRLTDKHLHLYTEETLTLEALKRYDK